MISLAQLKGYQVKNLDPIQSVVLLALTEIGERSGGRYSPQAVFERLKWELANDLGVAVWVGVDEAKRANGSGLNDSICGVMTLMICPDELGTAIAVISRGWIRKGYGGLPFDLAMPLVEAWARQKKAIKLVSMTERSSLGRASDRLDLKHFRARMNGLAAYARWIGQRGFRQRETIFEKVLT